MMNSKKYSHKQKQENSQIQAINSSQLQNQPNQYLQKSIKYQEKLKNTSNNDHYQTSNYKDD